MDSLTTKSRNSVFRSDLFNSSITIRHLQHLISFGLPEKSQESNLEKRLAELLIVAKTLSSTTKPLLELDTWATLSILEFQCFYTGAPGRALVATVWYRY